MSTITIIMHTKACASDPHATLDKAQLRCKELVYQEIAIDLPGCQTHMHGTLEEAVCSGMVIMHRSG